MKEITLNHIFMKYGKEEICNWCGKLQLFRLCLAHPYPDDLTPDRFSAIISFTNDEELTSILAKINFSLKLENSELVSFKEYNENHSAGWISINNSLANLDVNKIRKTITIDVSGSGDDLFKLSEDTFTRAIQIEQHLSKYDFQFIDPPEDDAKYCIAPKFYPEFWNQ